MLALSPRVGALGLAMATGARVLCDLGGDAAAWLGHQGRRFDGAWLGDFLIVNRTAIGAAKVARIGVGVKPNLAVGTLA